MEQQLVYLHTEKNLEETEQILKNQGFEIIYKSMDDEIDFYNLTEHEKISWINAFKDDLKKQIIDLQQDDKDLEKHVDPKEFISKKFVNVFNFIQNDNKFQTNEKFEIIVNEMRLIDDQYNIIKNWLDCLIFIDHNALGYSELRCSRLIAKRGSEKISYMAFLNDPILTLQSQNATNLKSTLEKKF